MIGTKLAVLAVIVGMLLIGASAYGQSELTNWDFSDEANGLVNGWTVIPGGSVTPVNGVGTGGAFWTWGGRGAAACNLVWVPVQYDNRMGQVVDDSLSPGWNPNLNAKVLNLMVDYAHINWGGDPNAKYGIRFRLDWWTDNSIENPGVVMNDPAPSSTGTYYDAAGPVTVFGATVPGKGKYQWTEWKTFEWQTAVNETQGWETNQSVFKDLLISDDQPKWVSVEVEWLQPDGHLTAVDNIRLTGQCVPEWPVAALAPFGFIALGLLKRRFVK